MRFNCTVIVNEKENMQDRLNAELAAWKRDDLTDMDRIHIANEAISQASSVAHVIELYSTKYFEGKVSPTAIAGTIISYELMAIATITDSGTLENMAARQGGKGYGNQILIEVAKLAIENDFDVDFKSVVDGETQNFYRRAGAVMDDDQFGDEENGVGYTFSRQAMQALIEGKPLSQPDLDLSLLVVCQECGLKPADGITFENDINICDCCYDEDD